MNKEEFNTLLSKLWFRANENNKQYLIYSMIYNYHNLSELMKKELINSTNDVYLSKDIAKALLIKDISVDKDFKFDFIKKLGQIKNHQDVYIRLLTKNYLDLDNDLKSTLFQLIKQKSFNNIFIQEKSKNNIILYKNFLDDIFNDKNLVYDYFILQFTKSEFFIENLDEKYSKYFNEIKSKIDIIYADKVKNQGFDNNLVFSESNLSEKIIIYKHWDLLTPVLKQKLKELLYNEQVMSNGIGLVMLFRGYNENDDNITGFDFLSDLSKILKDEIRANPSFLTKDLINDLFSDNILRLYLTKEIILAINSNKIPNYLSKETILSLTELQINNNPENTKILSNFLSKNLNKDDYKDIIIETLNLKEEFSHDKYQKYLKIINLFQKN
ncbi:MAG: hypothetical protein U0354_18770 [Candidatus Sericytochromatia bacterium]